MSRNVCFCGMFVYMWSLNHPPIRSIYKAPWCGHAPSMIWDLIGSHFAVHLGEGLMPGGWVAWSGRHWGYSTVPNVGTLPYKKISGELHTDTQHVLAVWLCKEASLTFRAIIQLAEVCTVCVCACVRVCVCVRESLQINCVFNEFPHFTKSVNTTCLLCDMFCLFCLHIVCACIY